MRIPHSSAGLQRVMRGLAEEFKQTGTPIFVQQDEHSRQALLLAAARREARRLFRIKQGR